jgi:hypothetical protein
MLKKQGTAELQLALERMADAVQDDDRPPPDTARRGKKIGRASTITPNPLSARGDKSARLQSTVTAPKGAK